MNKFETTAFEHVPIAHIVNFRFYIVFPVQKAAQSNLGNSSLETFSLNILVHTCAQDAYDFKHVSCFHKTTHDNFVSVLIYSHYIINKLYNSKLWN